MKVVGSFNKVSEKLKAKVKPLKKGESVSYRLLGGKFDIVDGTVKYGSMDVIVCRDTIYDEGTGEYVTIGVPKVVKDGEVVRVKKFNIAPVGENILHNGKFTLYGGNAEHMQFYFFFELSNINNSNPDRDPSVTARIEKIDSVKEAENEEKKLDVLTKALLTASEMTADEIKTFAAGLNWSPTVELVKLRKAVKEYAKDHPEEFMAAQDDPEKQMKLQLKQAFEAEIIIYVPSENKVLWGENQKTLAKLDKPQDGENEIELLAQWIKTTSNGEAALKGIKNRLKNTKE